MRVGEQSTILLWGKCWPKWRWVRGSRGQGGGQLDTKLRALGRRRSKNSGEQCYEVVSAWDSDGSVWWRVAGGREGSSRGSTFILDPV